MKPKQYRRFSLQKEKTARINRVPQLNPVYCGNIAHLFRLYLRICRNPYLHLPRVRTNRTTWHFIELDGHFYLNLGLGLPAASRSLHLHQQRAAQTLKPRCRVCAVRTHAFFAVQTTASNFQTASNAV